jgi:hypothetical protein
MRIITGVVADASSGGSPSFFDLAAGNADEGEDAGFVHSRPDYLQLKEATEESKAGKILMMGCNELQVQQRLKLQP